MNLGIIDMAERKLARIQKHGQVTLPAESRHRRGVKKGDLVEITETNEGWLVTPRKVVGVPAQADPAAGSLLTRTLTDEEVQRGLAALEQAKQSRQAQLARRGGKVLPSSAELIRQGREERSARL
jgi:AbrB family looped-hinge helix DNA binding protein